MIYLAKEPTAYDGPSAQDLIDVVHERRRQQEALRVDAEKRRIRQERAESRRRVIVSLALGIGMAAVTIVVLTIMGVHS